MFVDGYDFGAYSAAGMGKMDTMPKDVKLTAPELGGFGEWWKYLSNTVTLSPIPADKPTEFPEGVKVLGGTFVIDGEQVVFEYKDPVPGMTPDLDEVMNAI